VVLFFAIGPAADGDFTFFYFPILFGTISFYQEKERAKNF
jgi:hypothetical protein